jgi:enamine deaminase RidA (YjgF/YER057c/UK114 family)
MPITHINPAGMPGNPAFSHGTIAEGSRTLYVGGQNGVNPDGTITGGVGEQTRTALRNLLTVLEAAGATQQDVAKLTIILVDTADLMEAFEASREVWGDVPTAITGLRVSGLGRPEALVEIEAIAALP